MILSRTTFLKKSFRCIPVFHICYKHLFGEKKLSAQQSCKLSPQHWVLSVLLSSYLQWDVSCRGSLEKQQAASYSILLKPSYREGQVPDYVITFPCRVSRIRLRSPSGQSETTESLLWLRLKSLVVKLKKFLINNSGNSPLGKSYQDYCPGIVDKVHDYCYHQLNLLWISRAWNMRNSQEMGRSGKPSI